MPMRASWLSQSDGVLARGAVEHEQAEQAHGDQGGEQHAVEPERAQAAAPCR